MLFSAFLAPFIAAMLFIPFVRTIALQRGWVDQPDGKRKHHPNPTPNVGGIGIAAGAVAGMVGLLLLDDYLAFQLNAPVVLVVLGALMIFGAGLFDDIRNLGFKRKFVIQIIAAYLLLHAGFHFDVSAFPFVGDDPYNHLLYSFPLTGLWIIGLLNAINLLDGLDGLAGGVSLIGFACLAVIFGIQGNIVFAALCMVMIGALLAFLVFNFNPASIFMGDSGSLFLGYMLALCTLGVGSGASASPILAFLIPIFAIAIPLIDTGLCIVRRVMAGRSPFYPDHDHIHHRLARLWPKRKAVLILYAAALWFGLNAIFLTMVSAPLGIAVVVLNIVLTIAGLRFLGYQEAPEDSKVLSNQRWTINKKVRSLPEKNGGSVVDAPSKVGVSEEAVESGEPDRVATSSKATAQRDAEPRRPLVEAKKSVYSVHPS